MNMQRDFVRLNKIKEWRDFMIENQEQLKIENESYWPEWNAGYLECLEDLKAIMESKIN